mgnify:CR=1 FL=1
MLQEAPVSHGSNGSRAKLHTAPKVKGDRHTGTLSEARAHTNELPQEAGSRKLQRPPNSPSRVQKNPSFAFIQDDPGLHNTNAPDTGSQASPSANERLQTLSRQLSPRSQGTDGSGRHGAVSVPRLMHRSRMQVLVSSQRRLGACTRHAPQEAPRRCGTRHPHTRRHLHTLVFQALNRHIRPRRRWATDTFRSGRPDRHKSARRAALRDKQNSFGCESTCLCLPTDGRRHPHSPAVHHTHQVLRGTCRQLRPGLRTMVRDWKNDHTTTATHKQTPCTVDSLGQ